MFVKLIQWLEEHQLPCFYKKTLGVECPGCGMQRAFIELLKGDIWQSIMIYPALIPILFMIFFLMLHISLKFKKGPVILKITFIFNIVLITLNYIYKLII